MKYNEEIKEIREGIDLLRHSEVNNNYAKTLFDEELQDGVIYLESKTTGLPVDIIIDGSESYKIFNHKLCLYVVGTNNDVIPVTISEHPSILGFIDESISAQIVMFIQENLDTLIKHANLEIDSNILYDEIKQYKQTKTGSLHMVVEMATYGPEQTGLPVKVYIDDTMSYMRSGHNQSYRMKYQQDTNISNPRQWMPITIPDLQIMNNGKLPPSVIQQRKVNLVLQWAKGNMDLLLQLRDGKINGEYFKENMKTLDEIKVIMSSEIE